MRLNFVEYSRLCQILKKFNMLAVPQIGMAQSSEPRHNVQLDTLCDWIEASLAFDKLNFISGAEIVDVLHEEEIYESQDFAWELVHRALAELDRRQLCLSGGSPFKVEGKRLVRTKDWEDVPAYSFCLTLACAKWYPNWAASLVKKGKKRPDYTEQGHLFELVASSALEKLLPSWKIERTGWSPDNTKKIKQIVSDVAKFLREPERELNPWVSKDANEAGLDIVCYRPFDDSRPGLPTIFVQCASGKHHEHKLGTPNMKEWGKIIDFTAVLPQRSFVTPYVFTDSEFKRVSNKVDGLLLDRVRLLSAGSDGGEWLSAKLKTSLCNWMKPRVAKLERST